MGAGKKGRRRRKRESARAKAEPRASEEKGEADGAINRRGGTVGAARGELGYTFLGEEGGGAAERLRARQSASAVWP